MVYVEKEDEFDVVVDSLDPEGHKRKAEKEQEEEEAIVSIEAIDTVCLASLFVLIFGALLSSLRVPPAVRKILSYASSSSALSIAPPPRLVDS